MYKNAWKCVSLEMLKKEKYFLVVWTCPPPLLPGTKGVLLLEVEVAEGVVDVPVVGLVRPDGEDDLPHPGVGRQAPVHLLLFQVTHEPAGAGLC